MTNTFFCNKCGYVGPDEFNHEMPRTGGRICRYQAALIATSDESGVQLLKEQPRCGRGSK